MTRKAVLGSFLSLVCAIVFLCAVLALSPIWVTTLMINPGAGKGARDYALGRVMQEGTRIMFARARAGV